MRHCILHELRIGYSIKAISLLVLVTYSHFRDDFVRVRLACSNFKSVLLGARFRVAFAV